MKSFLFINHNPLKNLIDSSFTFGISSEPFTLLLPSFTDAPLSLWASRVCECRLKGFALVRKKRGTGSLRSPQSARREYVLSLRSLPLLALSLLSLRMECDLWEHCSFPFLSHLPLFHPKSVLFFLENLHRS